MQTLPKPLSKTRLMRGYQCLKSIYLTIHNKELEPPVGPDLQAIFDQGNVVGAKARKRYLNGVLVDNPAWDFFGALKKTRELLDKETEVIFEAAFEYTGLEGYDGFPCQTNTAGWLRSKRFALLDFQRNGFLNSLLKSYEYPAGQKIIQKKKLGEKLKMTWC